MSDYFTQCIADIKDNLPKTWEYVGYHHDACPSYFCNELQVFVDHPSPSERDSTDIKRYSVFNEDQEMLLHTDDLEEVKTFVEKH